MSTSAAILSILTGVAGWFYLFYSKAAGRLAEFEDQRLNRYRIVFRRMGGGVMLVLAVGLYLGFRAADEPMDPRLFMAIWSAVIILLGALVVLAFADVWLTRQLRAQRLQRTRGLSLESFRPDDRPPTRPPTDASKPD